MKAAILNKNDLNIDIKEQVSELFRQLSPNKIQLDLEEILNEKNQITVAYCEDNNKIILKNLHRFSHFPPDLFL